MKRDIENKGEYERQEQKTAVGREVNYRRADKQDYDRDDSVKYNGRFSSEYGREHYLDIHGTGEGREDYSQKTVRAQDNKR